MFQIKKVSLFKQILIGHFIVILVALTILSTLLTLVLENLFYQQGIKELKRVGLPIAQQMPSPNNQLDQLDLQRLNRILRLSHIHLLIVDKENKVVFPKNKDENPPVLQNVLKEIKKRTVTHGKLEWIMHDVIWVAIKRGEQGNKGTIVLYSPITGIVKALRQTRLVIILSASISLVVSIVISSWFSKNLAKRIRRLRELTQKINLTNTQGKIKINETGEDEITDLANDFNEMVERLEKSHTEINLFEKNRRQFILDLSHELRTPLTSIRGWIEALKKGYVNEQDQHRVYDNLEKETLRLIRLIQELMDLEKIRSGKVELKKDVYEVRELFDLATEQLSWMADEKMLKMRVDLPNDRELKVYGDYDRLLQIIVNLVKNGIQFTEKGEICLGAQSEEKSILIWVRDTGMGMNQEDLQRIWERFYKVESSRTRQAGETGLGLAIVKQLVEAHDGEILVESKQGKGTTFFIRLPLPQSSHHSV